MLQDVLERKIIIYDFLCCNHNHLEEERSWEVALYSIVSQMEDEWEIYWFFFVYLFPLSGRGGTVMNFDLKLVGQRTCMPIGILCKWTLPPMHLPMGSLCWNTFVDIPNDARVDHPPPPLFSCLLPSQVTCFIMALCSWGKMNLHCENAGRDCAYKCMALGRENGKSAGASSEWEMLSQLLCWPG